jgi:hypothetical protein
VRVAGLLPPACFHLLQELARCEVCAVVGATGLPAHYVDATLALY